MAKLNDTGVYQLTNKNWAFRYTITADGRKKRCPQSKGRIWQSSENEDRGYPGKKQSSRAGAGGQEARSKSQKVASKKCMRNTAETAGETEPTEPNKSRTAFGIITFV